MQSILDPTDVAGGPLTAEPRLARAAGSGQAFQDYFRCAREFAFFETLGDLSKEHGYFRLGDILCYGRCSTTSPAKSVRGPIPDVSDAISIEQGRLLLPFDYTEVIRNLQQERYARESQSPLERLTAAKFCRRSYYLFRPLLPIALRRHLQKIRLSGWERIAFPQWPVDVNVDALMQAVMGVVLRESPGTRIPFVWFWPEGAEGCVVMTHDVEGPRGRDFCPALMDLDDEFGIKSAFQIVPEAGLTSDSLLQSLRERGFEVNIHDLNHDGSLFENRDTFRERATHINRYAREFGSRGFRSGAMYREQSWYSAFEFSFDMSVPNVAHLEPQRGGCCTVMPYFVDHLVELPLTTVQDYSLFHILGDYSTALWKRQTELILSRYGFVSFIAHPDYVVETRARGVYTELLQYLSALRSTRHLWFAQPSEVDRWWRQRALMTVVRAGDGWRIEGPERERARLAYAVHDERGVTYTLAPPQ